MCVCVCVCQGLVDRVVVHNGAIEEYFTQTGWEKPSKVRYPAFLVTFCLLMEAHWFSHNYPTSNNTFLSFEALRFPSDPFSPSSAACIVQYI